MTIRHAGLRRLGSKAGSFLVSGALALSLTPAVAFANTGLEAGSINNALTAQDDSDATLPSKELAKVNASKEIVWPDGKWVETDKDGVYEWDTYIKGDNAHYGHYDLAVTFTTQEIQGVKTLTGIDLTSKGTTFGGKWGMISGKSGSIMGWLPEGVSMDATVTANEDGSYTVKPSVTGADVYGGFTISSLDLYEVTDGKLAQLREYDAEGKPKTVIDPEDGDEDPVYQTATYNKKADAFTVAKNEKAKVARLNVKVGDYFTFGKYIALANDVTDDAIAGYEAAAKTNYDAAVNGIGKKNRDSYTTAVYAMIVERELKSWLTTMNEGKKVEGEIADIDIVSAATKSCDSIKEALYASQGYSFPLSNNSEAQVSKNNSWSQLFSAVSDSLEITVDGVGKTTESKRVISDKTSVSKTGSGNAVQYVVTNGFAGGGDGLPVSGFYFYAIDKEKLTNEELWLLCKNSKDSGFKSKATYMTKNTLEHGILGAYGGSNQDVVNNEQFAYDAASKQLIVKDSSITHVVIQYGFGKAQQNGFSGVVYDLRSAESADEGSAKPLTTATIEVAENQALTYTGDKIEPALTVKLGENTLANSNYDVTYSNNVNAGQATAVVRAKSESTEYSGFAVANFTIEPKPITATDVTLGEAASKTYTGSAITPEISVTYGGKKLVQGTDYEVKATNNINVGKASATIKATGNYKGDLGTAEFEITPLPLTAEDVTIGAIADQAYTGKGLEPAITVQREVEVRQGRDTVKQTVGLVQGKDFEVVYSDNLKLGTATASIKATGNYSGDLGAKTFSIVKGSQKVAMSAASVSKKFGDKAFNVGAKRTAGDGALTYASSNAKVAAVDKAGNVTIKGKGTATITATAAATGNYNAASATTKVTVAAGSNPFTLKAANKTVKAAKVKKAKQTVAVSKLSGNKGGAVTYAVSKWNKAKAKKYFSIAKKTGKVTVKKGTPKGTYKFTVKATSAAKGNYAKTAKTVVVTVKVK